MGVVKVLNLVGDSTESWQDAIQKAVSEASRTVDNITGVEVMNTTGTVKNGEIVEYKANVNVAFYVDPNK